MSKTQAAAYQDLPIGSLVESTFNPRRNFALVALQGLADSIKAQGVLQPLLVRLDPIQGAKGRYEIIAGARRFRAAKLAKAKTVPVRIVHMTDAQALEAAVIENLQREDVHPLEEANGFKALLASGDYTIESIAEKVGKTPQFVALRSRLGDLIDEAQDDFLNDRMQLGHALALCRLTPANQKIALPEIWESRWKNGQNEPDKTSPVKVGRFIAWCASHFLLVLEHAPFNIADGSLPGGPCGECPKRSGNNALLFAEITVDSCTDPICYEGKLDAHIASGISAGLVQISDRWNSERPDILNESQYTEIHPRAERDDEGEDDDDEEVGTAGEKRELTTWAKERLAEEQKENTRLGFGKTCKTTVKAIIVQGENRGIVVDICHSLTCKTHPGQGERQENGHSSSGGGYTPETPEQKKAKRAKEILKPKLESLTALATLDAVLNTVPKKVTIDELRFVAQYLLSSLDHNELDSLALRWNQRMKGDKPNSDVTKKNMIGFIDEATVAELPRLMIEMSLWRGLASQWNGSDAAKRLAASAKLYEVDAKAIGARIRKELTDAAKEKAAKAR